MSTVLPNPKAIYCFDDLLELEELTGLKYELIDGHLVTITGGSKAHDLMTLGLFTEIDRHKDAHCRLYVADVKLRLAKKHNDNNKETSMYPDVMLACSEEASDI